MWLNEIIDVTAEEVREKEKKTLSNAVPSFTKTI